MAYVFVTGGCYGCGRIFSFHPNKVPSLPVNGARQPICLACVTRVNPERERTGLPPIVPLPGAYEAAPEHEINWED